MDPRYEGDTITATSDRNKLFRFCYEKKISFVLKRCALRECEVYGRTSPS